MIRIAFTLIGGKNWRGGQNYLLNLVKALVEYDVGIQPVIFVGLCAKEWGSLHELTGVDLVYDRAFDDDHKLLQILKAMLFGCDRRVKRIFKENNIDFVFEACNYFGWRLGLPVLAWFPDLQHKVLPKLFKKSAWWKREIGFQVQLLSRRNIMLSSEAARRDCEIYYPRTKGRTHVVTFATKINHEVNLKMARSVADRYNLPRNYVFLPNQFWKHKNHMLVIAALKILKEQGNNCVIAACGARVDFREPEYFESIEKHIQNLGIGHNFRLLGEISSDDLYALMQASQAVLNPSLFEGWSTTVEEAKALGVHAILSDLEVHVEQMGLGAQYFARNSAIELSLALERLPPFDPVDRADRSLVAQKINNERVAEYARKFSDLVRFCVGEFNTKKCNIL